MSAIHVTDPSRTLRVPALLAASVLALGVTLAQVPARVSAATATTTLDAVADTYLDSTKPTANFGSRSTLYADASPTRAVLLRFAVPASPDPVTRAVLRVYVTGPSPSGIAVAQTAGGWGEPNVTWSTAPAAGAPLGDAAAATKGTWATVDVTGAVTPGLELDLRVTTPGSRQVGLAAKEAGSATAPKLVIETAPVGSPSPTPVSPSPTPTAATPTSSPTVTPSPTGTSSARPADVQPTFPIRAAFYYPWFPEAWNQSGISPFTRYTPTRGYYDGRSASVISAQIDDLLYAGMDAGIASWWGQGSKEDARIPLLLSSAAGTPFRWSIYYEPESLGDPSSAQIANDLAHIATIFGTDPSYLRIDGKPVVFVYADAADGCDMAARWGAGNTVGAYVVLKVFPGYAQCANQPQGWHQYGPASARSDQSPYSFSVSPGFWLRTDSAARLTRDPVRFESDVAAMAASAAKFQLVTTFNEWGEGTSVESAAEWGSASGRGTYLDILHARLAPGPTPTPTSASPTATSGSPSPTATSTSPSPLPSQSSGADPVIAAVGDISCDPTSGSFNGGLGTATQCRQKATSDLALGIAGLDAVLAVGDLQYEDNTLDKYMASYDLSWGRLRAVTKPVPGNHEYLTANAAGYFDYFGAAAGDRSKGYYSYDLGSWHIVALNSNCSQVGGCSAGSPQLTWLKADLAAHPSTCTMAYFHHPRFSSGQHGNNTGVTPLWDALAAAGAEVVLSGHDHNYERFAPQTSAGVASPDGIRQFVVGMGGKNHYGLTAVQPNSEITNVDTYGVLRMALHANSYDWQFLPEAGKAFTDAGSAACH